MAAETVASHQIPTSDEEVEKKTAEYKNASEPKGSGEEVPKTEDSPSLAALSESEAVDNKKIEPPVIEAEKTTDAPVLDIPVGVKTEVQNKSIPDSLPKLVADAVEIPAEIQSSIKSVVREAAIDVTETGQVEQPKIVDASLSSVEATEKPEEPLEVTSDKGLIASSIPLVDESVVEHENISDFQTTDIPKQLSDVVESPAEVHSLIESVVEAPKEPKVDITEIEQVEQREIVDAPQSSVEAIEKPEEPLDVTSDKGSVETVLKEIKDSQPEYLEVQKPELAVSEVEEKIEHQYEFRQEVKEKHDEIKTEERVQDETVKDAGSVDDKVEILDEGKTEREDTPSLAVEKELEQPKLTEQEQNHDEVGPEKSVEDEKVKDEGSSVEKVEESTFLEEGKTGEDDKPSLIRSSEEASLSREVQIELKDEGDSSLTGAKEKIATEDEKKELSGVDVVEKQAEEAAVESEKVGEVNVEAGEAENRNVIPDDATQPIKEGQQKEVVEKVAEKAAVELEGIAEKKVENEEDGKKNSITEDSVKSIIEDQKKELGGADVIEKLAEEAVVQLEKVEEENVAKNVETEDNENRNAITEDSTQAIEEDLKKELGGVDVVEKLGEVSAVETEKLGEEIETKNVKFEDKEIRNVIDEVSTQPLKEDVNSSISPSTVVEKSFEAAEKDVEPAVENEKAENIKYETPAKVELETKAVESVEEKLDEVSRAVNEPLTDSKQSESEVNGQETVQAVADKLENVADDVAKPDQIVEPPPTKDGDLTKPSQDLPKEVPAKPSPKQSNTILSKVKQSLVKAKKVLTGKSPSSKTPASGAKDDIKVI